MEKIRCALVGCGVISPTHAAAIRNTPSAELIAVCDIVEARAKKLAQDQGCDYYTDIDEMLRRDDIDLVHVLVPSGDHANVGVKAAKAGKHVIVEKPIDVTLEAANRLISACREAGVTLSCISQHRFDPDIAALKTAIADGKLGKVNYGCSHTKWYRSQEYYDSGDWRGTWALDGGGALMNQSVHYVDMLQYLCGEVDEVMAYCATRSHTRIEVEDCAAAAVRFKSGAIGLIEGNTTAIPGFCTRLDVYGDKGGAIIENDRLVEWRVGSEVWRISDGTPNPLQQVAVSGGQADKVAGAGSAAIGSDSHTRQVSDVVDAILKGRAPAITGEAALNPLSIILSIYESSKTNKPVKVK